jgi:hypothetical protein
MYGQPEAGAGGELKPTDAAGVIELSCHQVKGRCRRYRQVGRERAEARGMPLGPGIAASRRNFDAAFY